MRHLVLIPLLLCSFVFGAYSQAQERNAGKFLPAIMMLLENDQIPIQIGQINNTRFTSRRYPDGVTFGFGLLANDLELTVTLTGIPTGKSLVLMLNGSVIAELHNGINTIVLAATNLLENTIRIGNHAGQDLPWVLTQFKSVLRDAGPQTRAQAQQFLMRGSFGPTLAELDRLLAVGYESWINEQIKLPRASSIDAYNQHLQNQKEAATVDVSNNGPTSQCISRGFSQPADCISYMHALLEGSGAARIRMDQWWHRTINGEDQLRQRVVYALSQILVTSLDLGDALRGRNRAVVVYEDVLSKNAFGNFRTLLKDVTLNPAMAYYLSFVGNQKAGRFGQPDENYAREILQLFSIGLVELNLDGSPKLDRNGNEIETYTPDTIQNLARIFTGWIYAQGSFVFSEWDLEPLIVWAGGSFHDSDPKVFLGRTHPAGLTAEEDLDMALDTIFNHPNVGPFISTRLIERLVMSNPPPEYVARVATVFNNNGAGVRGDLAAVVKAILMDPAAFNSATSASGGKIKEPIIAISQLWRAMNAESDIDVIRYANPHNDVGQRPYDAPSVFNFYAPSDTTPALAQQNLVAPELTLFSDDVVLNYLRNMYRLATSAPQGSDPISDSAPYSSDTTRTMTLNLSEAQLSATTHEKLLDFYQERLFGGIMSNGLRNDVITFLKTLPDQGSASANRRHWAEQALTVLTVSPEYNFQR